MALINRSQELTDKVKNNILAMIVIKGLSILISFLYVPLLYNTLDVQHYGIWLCLTSIVSWISMFDIGLGHGLRNNLAGALAEDNYHLGKKYVSTAYVCITALSVLMIIVFLSIRNHVSWDRILNAGFVNIGELNALVTIVIISFCMNFMLNIINSVLYALQRPALSSFILMLGQLLSYIAVCILVKFCNITSLIVLGSAISIIPVIVAFISTIFLFGYKYRSIAPSIHYFDISKVHDILGLGAKFFIIQLSTVVLYQTNNLIITHTVGNDAVVEYNIAYKYMSILVMVFNMVATPLWSATTDAYTRGDYYWIKNTNKNLLKIVMIMTFGGLIMLALSSIAYKLWLGESSVQWQTSALLYLYSVFMMIYGCYGYLLNGIGKLKIQLIVSMILAIGYIPLAFFAGKLLGLSGVLIVFIFVNIANCIWSKIQYTKLMNKSAKGIWAQ